MCEFCCVDKFCNCAFDLCFYLVVVNSLKRMFLLCLVLVCFVLLNRKMIRSLSIRLSTYRNTRAQSFCNLHQSHRSYTCSTFDSEHGTILNSNECSKANVVVHFIQYAVEINPSTVRHHSPSQ